MPIIPTLVDLPDTPRYPIRTVSARTGIPAVTLRAWERRYQLVAPQRTAGNYRLYSERDIGILGWVKGRVDVGVAVGRAAADVGAMRRSGRWPAVPAELPGTAVGQAEATAEVHSRRLYDALVAHAEVRATGVLRAAHAELDVETVCLRVLQPCLVAIGAAWHRGEVRIATEHFASQLLRGHIMALFQAVPMRRRAAHIVVGCAPHERHDIGALIFALFLRRAGYHVEFLGADVHLADLVAHANASHPDLVCLSANAEATALALAPLQSRLDALTPAPRFGFGGAAFTHSPALRAQVPGHYLGDDPAQALARIRAVLAPQPANAGFVTNEPGASAPGGGSSV